jgi:hypothetical protein
MSQPFRTLEEYELFLYTLAEQFNCIRYCTVTLVRRGASLGRVSGEIHFDHGFRLVLLERILAERLPVVIEAYGYEIWRAREKLCWYDCQPHPEDPMLASTHPHHKHIPPDLKRHRVPAPEMSFTRPNLPKLIAEIEALLVEASGAATK